MIVSSLCEYYKINESRLSAFGYSKRKAHYLVMLTSDGIIDDVVFLGKEEVVGNNKRIIKFPTVELPFRTEKTSIEANIVEQRPLYLFGLEYKSGEFCESDKAKKSHAAFKDVTLNFFKDITSPIAVAFYKFVESWKPEKQAQNQFLLRVANKFTKSSFIFALTGRPDIYLNDDIAVKEKWDKFFVARVKEENSTVAQCVILGRKLPIARIHYKIRGIKGGKSSGCTYVCVNSDAQESYGKTQSYNSNISYMAMCEYTEAFNYLLEEVDDKRVSHKTELGDMTIVHFALAKDEEAFKQISYVNDNIFAEFTGEPSIQDIEQEVKESFKLISKGKVSEFETEKSDLVEYCIFGVIPNESRLMQRFFYRNTFGIIRRNVEQYNADFAIGKKNKAPSLKAILYQLTPNKDDNDKKQEINVSPDIGEALLMAMLMGVPFPQKLLQTAVRRIKTDAYGIDKFLNDTNAGLVKACLNRNYNKDKEKIKVALDTNNTKPAYLCGRLFAVMENIQNAASNGKKLNKTIKNTYFTSACTTPAVVFPKIIMLSNAHQEKLSAGLQFYFSNLIGEIIDDLNGEFPKTLSLEEQGTFIIGYYHQKNCKSKEENITEENKNGNN